MKSSLHVRYHQSMDDPDGGECRSIQPSSMEGYLPKPRIVIFTVCVDINLSSDVTCGVSGEWVSLEGCKLQKDILHTVERIYFCSCYGMIAFNLVYSLISK